MNGKLEFNLYHKTTFSGRYLSFLSLHPLSQKRGVLMSMVDRAFLLSHPKYHYNNFIFIIKIFLENDYPLKFIFDTINSRLGSLFKHKTLKQTDNSNNDEKITSWFTIPFLPYIYDKFKSIVKKDSNVRLSFFSLNKLDGIIKAQKDVLPHDSKKNVVYKINCKDCNASYVGQTGRKLKTRINEHKKDINKKSGNFSVVSEHKIEFDHDFDWENIKILDNERFFGKRCVSEMLNIKMLAFLRVLYHITLMMSPQNMSLKKFLILR
ncbi:hypothetical protein ALC57_14177 [Trachymyrmex cornetzi]|uniref:Uncharacterized protein n=1 Tax=Trachymyrmex cornetzi TaxID=471704 RepID=A0A151IYX8_9HYME|nr:hypothetical protein ALC57_14177 [Trachymyrmex cornetzi]